MDQKMLWNKLKRVEVKLIDVRKNGMTFDANNFVTKEFYDAEIHSSTKSKPASIVRDEQKLFECDICHVKYKRKYSLTRHKNEVHTQANKELKNRSGSIENVRRFECGICHSKFTRKEHTKQHLKHSHKNEEENWLIIIADLPEKYDEKDKQIQGFFDLKCPKADCDFIGKKFGDYVSHLTTVHNERKPGLVCCGKKLAKRGIVIDHINFHRNPEKLQCKHCKQIYSETRSLKSHINRVHGNDEVKRFTCEPCGKRFSELSAIRSHMYQHLTDAAKDQLRIYKCGVCKKTYYHKESLKTHLKQSHLKTGIKCFECNRLFGSRNRYEFHRRDVHGAKGPPRVQCPTCKKSFSRPDTLKVHIRAQHDKTETFICDICGRKYHDKMNLRNHFRMIHMEGAFKCDYCSKLFPAKKNLNEHLAVHTGVPLHSCPYCSNKHFNQRSNMYAHIRAIHPKKWLERKELATKNN